MSSSLSVLLTKNFLKCAVILFVFDVYTYSWLFFFTSLFYSTNNFLRFFLIF
ncbi:unnamed protein product [Meloidogyne enterolobii]|uniref:Uncharacterized protein n=1 Tax=Meloidogyne enterolobii TaxID=390850 RepID=A0ACB0YER3_MELEN